MGLLAAKAMEPLKACVVLHTDLGIVHMLLILKECETCYMIMSACTEIPRKVPPARQSVAGEESLGASSRG